MFNGLHKVGHYAGNKPKMDVKEYFNGKIKAWGIIQDWRGRVVSKFDIDLVGTWNGDVGKLAEEFHFYDGRKMQRSWTIQKIDESNYKGMADDVDGVAPGEIKGDAVNWKYVMQIPVDGKIYKLNMNDWMWQMNDGVLINRSYMKKFGITVAELTLFMQKQ